MRKLLPALLVLVSAYPAAAKDDSEKLWSKLQPARGVYLLRQRGAGDDNPVALSGRLIIEARLDCDDVTSTLDMNLRVTSGGQTMTLKVEQKSSETLDGRIYRFSAATYENGRETERREGQAVLQSRDGPGEAAIKGATNEDLKLDRGIVLPGTHMMRTLQAAAAGQTSLENRVFYGFDQMKITTTRVSIMGAGRSPKTEGLGEFADKPGWRLREEYKEIGREPGAATQFAETFTTEDGVVTSLTLSTQGMELAGTALSIEKLPKPACPD